MADQKTSGSGPKPEVELETLLGVQFTNPGLLGNALTHGSSEEGANYQRLEFLGDRVLGLVITDALFTRFGDESEGDLSRRLAGLVRKEMLVTIATSLNLADWVRVADDEKVHLTAGVIADVMEAVLGAVYLDQGIEEARRLILTLWEEELGRDIPKDAKSTLQELVQGMGRPLPVYRGVGKSGPDHAPEFTVEVSVTDEEPASGQGKSKRAAETAAAEALLARLNADE